MVGTSKSEIPILKLETISNFEYQMTKTFQIFTQHLRDSSPLEFWILVIRICFGFRISCFEFIENRISKQFLLSQQVISLNDVTLAPHPMHEIQSAMHMMMHAVRRYLVFADIVRSPSVSPAS